MQKVTLPNGCGLLAEGGSTQTLLSPPQILVIPQAEGTSEVIQREAE